MADPRICSIPGCGNVHQARGWCSNHYRRWMRNGDPLGGTASKGELERYYREVVLSWTGNECLIWPYGRGTQGYANFQKDKKRYIVHRCACEHVNGPPPTPKHEAAHSCGKGHLGCVNPKHLSWKTKSENQQDRLLHGTSNRGDRMRSAKLTEHDVRTIRSLKGVRHRSELAEKYGISAVYVNKIQSRKAWPWLE